MKADPSVPARYNHVFPRLLLLLPMSFLPAAAAFVLGFYVAVNHRFVYFVAARDGGYYRRDERESERDSGFMVTYGKEGKFKPPVFKYEEEEGEVKKWRV